MNVSFYNTMTRTVDPFVPLAAPKVTFYTCGPTVYNYAHIGNLRSYCAEDLFRRILEYSGYDVLHVMNITDVEDKIIKACLAEKMTLNGFTEPYIKAFKEDIASLNVKPAAFYPKASEHINEIVDIIKELCKREIAYKGDDGSYYFSIERFSDYGKLARLDKQDLRAGARICHDEYDKEHLSDFALWKAWDEGDGDIFWETEIGKGRPGWHMECSAMSIKYLGETIDIHMGGVDNIFPHHENEIAQSEASTGKKFVNYWVHCEHLLSDGRKMSKSLGNFFTLRDLVEKGYSPIALRYLYIANHYRSKLNFTLKALDSAANTLNGLYDFLKRLSRVKNELIEDAEFAELFARAKATFDEKIYTDMNMPQALSCIFSMISHLNIMMDKNCLPQQQAVSVIDYFMKIDAILALNLGQALEDDIVPEDIEKLIEERQSARKAKDFKRSDEIRDLLSARGIILQDTPQGVVWKKM